MRTLSAQTSGEVGDIEEESLKGGLRTAAVGRHKPSSVMFAITFGQSGLVFFVIVLPGHIWSHLVTLNVFHVSYIITSMMLLFFGIFMLGQKL